MKKAKIWLMMCGIILSCSACGTEGADVDTEMTDTFQPFQNSDIQPEESIQETASLPEESTALPEALAVLDTLDLAKLDCYADVETSLRNSNLLNYGYVTYDEDGHIYFTDTNIGKSGIFVSDVYGENLKMLSEDTAVYMQFKDGWLYYCGAEQGIKRLQVETGKEEWIYEEPCGEFVLKGEKLYINASEGFCRTNLDGSEKEILRQSGEMQIVCYTEGQGMWFGNAISDTDASWFWNGYLTVYSEADEKTYYVGDNATYPLLAGNWLSVVSKDSVSRKVWNLETQEVTDLDMYAMRAVSDGSNLYCANRHGFGFTIYKWDGSKTEELFEIEAEELEYMYLTDKALYYLPTVIEDNKRVQQLWYYDLESGETGKIY